MANPATLKMRVHRARKRAEENLRNVGYGVFHTDGGLFDLIAVRESDARFICVMSEKIDREQMIRATNRCLEIKVPRNCQREIWVCSGGKNFTIAIL